MQRPIYSIEETCAGIREIMDRMIIPVGAPRVETRRIDADLVHHVAYYLPVEFPANMRRAFDAVIERMGGKRSVLIDYTLLDETIKRLLPPVVEAAKKGKEK